MWISPSFSLLVFVRKVNTPLCQTHLGPGVLLDVVQTVRLPELVRPRSHSANMERQVLLVRCGREREGVVLAPTLNLAGDAHPLARLVFKVCWPLELVVCHIWRWKNICIVLLNRSNLFKRRFQLNIMFKYCIDWWSNVRWFASFLSCHIKWLS